MSLDKSDVEKIAHLARLAIDESTIPDYARDLNNILTPVSYTHLTLPTTPYV